MRRRNVRKLALRPPLPRRAVVWFPPFPIDANIEAFRTVHDPLAPVIAAHLHLVFPFACPLSALQLATHTRRVVAKWPPLPVTFRDIESVLDTFILLMVRDRAEAVVALHDALYTKGLKNNLRTDIAYTPHVTLARAPARETFPAMLEHAEQLLRGREWRMVMRELTVVTHHPDGTITRDHTVPLHSN